MKKNVLLFCIAVFLICIAFNIACADNQTYKSGDLVYSILDDGTVEIVKYNGNDSSFDIPNEIKNYKVTRIGDDAFKNNDNLRYLDMGSNIVFVGSSAFEGCTSLKSIYYMGSSSIQYIGESAFKGCIALTSIDIPRNLSAIQASTFEGCTSLRKVYYLHSSSVTSIGEKAFLKCVSLEEIDIPSDVTAISESAFEGCNHLVRIYYMRSSAVTVIGKRAFKDCSRLKEIESPRKLVEIGESAFEGCKKLTVIKNLNEDDVTFGVNAFANCPKMEKIPEKVVIDESQLSVVEDEMETVDFPCFIDVAALSDNAMVFGSWHSTGLMINNVEFDLPDYETVYYLIIDSNGTASASRDNNTMENGSWERRGAELVIDFERSDELVFWITENNILMQNGEIGIIFTNDNAMDPIITPNVDAKDDRQFNGEWKLSRVISEHCRLSPASLYYAGIDDSLFIHITDDSADVTLGKDEPRSISYKKNLINGNLVLSNNNLGTSIQLSLTETGEIVFPLYESGSVLYICLTNSSVDTRLEFEESEITEAQVHYIFEKDLSISIPPEIVSVNREADSSHSFYHKGYADYDSLHSIMISDNIYLYGVSEDRQIELTLSVLDYSDVDFNTADDAWLSTYKKQLELSLGWTAKDVEIDVYQGRTNKAIRIKYALETLFAGDQYIVLYYTTHKDNLLKMQFLSYGEEITAEQENMVQEIFDSIEWLDTIEPRAITDSSIGLSYTIPSYWKEEKDLNGITMMPLRYRIGSDNAWVSCGREDLWENYYVNNSGTADVYSINRSNYFDYKRLEVIVAQQLNCDDNMIFNKLIADNKYYYAGESARNGYQDLIYFYFKNGYMYKFCLGGDDASKYTDQLEKFLMTVEFDDFCEIQGDVENNISEQKVAEPFTLGSGVYHVGNDINPGIYYVQQVIPSDYDYSYFYLYSLYPTDYKNIILSERFKLGEEQKKIAIIEKGEYIKIDGGDLTFSLSSIPDDYYQYEIPEGMYMPIGYYTVGEEIAAGLYSVFSGSITGGCISVFPAGTEPDDSGMYIHMVISQESVTVGANNTDGKTIILREGKVVCVDAEVVLRKVRDLTDEEKVEEAPEWEW